MDASVPVTPAYQHHVALWVGGSIESPLIPVSQLSKLSEAKKYGAVHLGCTFTGGMGVFKDHVFTEQSSQEDVKIAYAAILRTRKVQAEEEDGELVSKYSIIWHNLK